MANHVHTHVEFQRINEAAQNRLKELYAKVREDSTYKWFGDIFVVDDDFDKIEDRSWMVENVGAKWCYFEDRDEDYFTTESAWAPPIDGIEKLLEDLSQYDKKLLTVVRYEDEFPNFIGAAVYVGKTEIDSREDEDDEILEMAMEKFPEIKGKFDFENGEWEDEESEEFWNDIAWEYRAELMDDFVSETLDLLG
jgi:hypothetical protein